MKSTERETEEAAGALDAATDPFAIITAAAKACGFPQRTLDQLIKRIEVLNGAPGPETKGLNSKELIEALNAKVATALSYLDDFVLAGSSAKDLMVVAAVGIDKMQLLKGEPTQILSHQERQGMNDLLPLVLAEARRRGLVDNQGKVIDLGTGEYEVAATAPAALPHKTGVV